MKVSDILFELDDTSKYLHDLLYKAQNEGSWEAVEVSALTQKAAELREAIAQYFELGEYQDPAE